MKNEKFILDTQIQDAEELMRNMVDYIAVVFFSRYKTYPGSGPGPKSALGPVRSPSRPPWTYVDAEFYQEFVFDSFRRHWRC